MERGTAEIVTREEIAERIGGRAYIGYEPVWPIHVGWLIWINKARDLQEAGFNVVVLEATWHAYINDKGDWRELRDAADRIREFISRTGLTPRYVDAEELVGDREYWRLAIRVAKASSLARVRRALTIAGRRVEEAEAEFAKLIYPILQVTDALYLGVDVALGGMDQRKAHMLARDVAEKLGIKKPTAIHTPVVTSLSGVGRMEWTSGDVDAALARFKMSKSKPESAILVTDSDEEVYRKVEQAYCPPNETRFNPVFELAAYLIIPFYPPLRIGDEEYWDAKKLEEDYKAGRIDPRKLKYAVAEALTSILAKYR